MPPVPSEVPPAASAAAPSPRLGFVEVCGNDQVVAGICLVRFVGALIIGVDVGYSLVRATRRRVNNRLTVDGQKPGRNIAAELPKLVLRADVEHLI